MKYKSSFSKELEEILLDIKTRKLLHEFLIDLLSPTEYKDLSVRWQIIKLLHKGASHRDIAKKLKVSVATVTRGSRELMNKKGGFKQILQKYYSRKTP